MLLEKPLFIFEMANNHMGDVNHGLLMINEFGKNIKKYPEFDFAIKFQYRDLATFIHPDYKNRMDIKYVKRFVETELSESQFLQLKQEAEKLGFITICTAFDEISVEKVIDHNYDIIKVASCSLTDWPLLEKIVQKDKPVILSTAGGELIDIDKVVSFFEHRNKNFAVMHCVGEYPTVLENLELDQIDFLKNRYKNIPVGYSTHESPDDFESIKLAVAKNAVIFEKHIAVNTDIYKSNAYSATPDQISNWLESARLSFVRCGIANCRRIITEKEFTDLRGLQRGVFAKESLKNKEKITSDNVFYAIPNTDNQLVANDLSKYTEYRLNKIILSGQPVFIDDVIVNHLRERVVRIVRIVKEMINESKITLPFKSELEISHHFGIDKFYETGAVIFNIINREYCKKIIILLPGQSHPVHLHKVKEETFNVLFGELECILDGKQYYLKPGEDIVVRRNTPHSFSSKDGAIFEELSTTHYKNDSFYDDPEIQNNDSRKTLLTFWRDWLNKDEIQI